MTVTLQQPDRRYETYRSFADDYADSGWTDGLPVLPPTVERVREVLKELALEPDEILGGIPTQDVSVTAEQVVINAIMAGCLAAYMPLVISAARAFLDPKSNAHGTTGSLASPAHMVLVNGPARASLDIRCAAGCFGPGGRANATIGRALRLVIRNCCNAIPGLADRAAFSQPARYSFCFGEDEESSNWVPLHVERGFAPEDNVVTVSSFTEMYLFRDLQSRNPEELLRRFASVARSRPVHVDHALGEDRTVLLVVGPEHRALLQAAGWAKQDVRDYMYPLLTAPATAVDSEGRALGWGLGPEGGEEECTFGLPNPNGLLLAAAGGRGFGASVVFYPHWSAAVSRRF
jgi:hypothetical protein